MQRKSQVKRKKRSQVLLRLAISKASNNESVKREKELYIVSRRLQGQALYCFNVVPGKIISIKTVSAAGRGLNRKCEKTALRSAVPSKSRKIQLDDLLVTNRTYWV